MEPPGNPARFTSFIKGLVDLWTHLLNKEIAPA